MTPFDESSLAAEVARVLETVPFYERVARGTTLEQLKVLRRDDLLDARPEQLVRRDVDLPGELAKGTIRPITTSGSPVSLGCSTRTCPAVQISATSGDSCSVLISGKGDR